MLASILPVFLILLLGVAIRQFRWMPADFFPSIEAFAYNLAFPAMLFLATARLNLHGGQVALIGAATLLPTALVLVLCVLGLRIAPRIPNGARSSIVQGATRPNTYFGLAVSSLFFDASTSSLVVLALALCLPAVNVVAVLALSWWSGQTPDARAIGRALVRNPIILSSLGGLLWSWSGLPLPKPIALSLDIVGRSALCLGLLCVGGGLHLAREGLRPLALGVTAALKLLVMPLAAAVIAAALTLPPEIALAACFYCALPTAPNAYIMARQMGGDAQLMANMITVQTFLALVTVPFAIHYFSGLGGF